MVARCVSPECTKAAGRADSFVVSADYTGQNSVSDRRGNLVPGRGNFALQAHSELYAGQKNDRHHEKQQLLLDFSRRPAVAADYFRCCFLFSLFSFTVPS